MPISLVEYVAQTQDKMRKELVQKITNESLFFRILRFIEVDGFTYRYAEQATLGGVAFRALNEQYSENNGVVNPKEENTAILGGVVKTDHQLVETRGDVARANAILARIRKAGLFYDKYVIDGDPATNPKEFYGLNARLTGNQVVTAGANGAALTLSMVDDLIDRVVGPNERKVLIMNKADRRKLKQLIVAAAGGAAVVDVGGSLKSYDGVAVEVLDEDGDEAAILAKDETQGSSNVTSSIYCIQPGQDIEGEYVQGLVNNKLVNQYASGMEGVLHVDVVEMNAGLAVFHGRAAARLKGLT